MSSQLLSVVIDNDLHGEDLLAGGELFQLGGDACLIRIRAVGVLLDVQARVLLVVLGLESALVDHGVHAFTKLLARVEMVLRFKVVNLRLFVLILQLETPR